MTPDDAAAPEREEHLANNAGTPGADSGAFAPSRRRGPLGTVAGAVAVSGAVGVDAE